jgi:monovalent cation/hydrogen antiporter
MAGGSPTDWIARMAFQGSMRVRECRHLETIAHTKPTSWSCARCIEEGTTTVHLRMCLVCGEPGCCDSSEGRHARRHHEETGHLLIRSIEPGERWVWCYADRAYLTGIVE